MRRLLCFILVTTVHAAAVSAALLTPEKADRPPQALLRASLIQGPARSAENQDVTQPPQPLPPTRKARPKDTAPMLVNESQASTPAPSLETISAREKQPASAETSSEGGEAADPLYQADYLDNPAPAYPSLSRRLREEGKVILKVYVEKNGLPVEVLLHSSSGHERLDEAAMQTVRRWKFVPARRSEEDVAGWVLVPISFQLRG